VLAPAIGYAERGFAVSSVVNEKWQLAAPLLKNQPGFAEHFLPRGRAPEIGEHFVLAGAARTLKLVAESGGEAFYRGEIAAAIGAHARAHGGAMTEADLSTYWDFVRRERLGRHDQPGLCRQGRAGLQPARDPAERPGASRRSSAWASSGTPGWRSTRSTPPTGITLMIEAMKLAFATPTPSSPIRARCA